MWVFLVAPFVVIALVTVVGTLRRAPRLAGADPAGLRTVVEWRDELVVAADISGDAKEQLRQLVGALAEQHFIFSASIDDGRDSGRGPFARVDVRELRFELRVRRHRAGRWLLWVDQRSAAPPDSGDLRQLLIGLYRTLEARRGEEIAWHRREELARARGAPSPFYER